MTTRRKAAQPADTAPDATPAEEAPPVFRFQLPEGLAHPEPPLEGEPAIEVTRISFGHSPRVSLAAGETYTTTDPREAARLRRVPELVEVPS